MAARRDGPSVIKAPTTKKSVKKTKKQGRKQKQKRSNGDDRGPRMVRHKWHISKVAEDWIFCHGMSPAQVLKISIRHGVLRDVFYGGLSSAGHLEDGIMKVCYLEDGIMIEDCLLLDTWKMKMVLWRIVFYWIPGRWYYEGLSSIGHLEDGIRKIVSYWTPGRWYYGGLSSNGRLEDDIMMEDCLLLVTWKMGLYTGVRSQRARIKNDSSKGCCKKGRGEGVFVSSNAASDTLIVGRGKRHQESKLR
ncbi:hypothetical protein CDAR_43851 [Caerostris darwini]|uniref:Uncharacterized protein n=1 Tax=Caerostris darwini TaxID=1538125 RepID=A0AAV4WKN7_9ARAC|nr:hypothetical protein CDAR_43851 [Caerostris darwini]